MEMLQGFNLWKANVHDLIKEMEYLHLVVDTKHFLLP